MKEIGMCFEKEGLLQDIAEHAWLESRNMEESEQRRVADVLEDGSAGTAARMLDSAYCEVISMLQAFVRTECCRRTAVCGGASEKDVYALWLTVPEGFMQSVAAQIETHVREYMVSRVMAEWLMVTNTERAQVWAGLAERHGEAIRRLRHLRSRATRRKTAPF